MAVIGRIGTVNLPKVACLSGWNNFKAAIVITGAPLALLSTEVASAKVCLESVEDIQCLLDMYVIRRMSPIGQFRSLEL